jgi:hypothetical protein
VVAVEYRGWGDSTPILPSEETIYIDANVAWAELVRRQPDPLKRVVFRTLDGQRRRGGACKPHAHRRGLRRLILEAGFTRLPDIAKAAGAMGTIASWFSTQEFNSLEKDRQGRCADSDDAWHGGSHRSDRPRALALRRRAEEQGFALGRSFPGGSHAGLDRESPELYRRTVRGFIEQLKTGKRPPGRVVALMHPPHGLEVPRRTQRSIEAGGPGRRRHRRADASRTDAMRLVQCLAQGSVPKRLQWHGPRPRFTMLLEICILAPPLATRGDRPRGPAAGPLAES